jgi:hypothetical protein
MDVPYRESSSVPSFFLWRHNPNPATSTPSVTCYNHVTIASGHTALVTYASRANTSSIVAMMEATIQLTLPTPEKFQAFPYDPPYDIQVELMRHLYSSIESSKVAIVESPTGTGKTLSLLTSSLTWLADDRERARRGEIATAGSESSGVDWITEQTVARRRRELEAEDAEYEERLLKAKKREMQRRKDAARVKRLVSVKEKVEELNSQIACRNMIKTIISSMKTMMMIISYQKEMIKVAMMKMTIYLPPYVHSWQSKSLPKLIMTSMNRFLFI